MPKKLLAVIIKGNPRYISTPEAKHYYTEIEEFLKRNGVSKVVYDAGEELTRPRTDADLYIAHSRGTGRKRFMPEDKQKVFLSFGVPGGVIDPVDLKWATEVWVKGTVQQPPPEHFIFIKAQQQAILDLLETIKQQPALEAARSKFQVTLRPAYLNW